MKLIDYIEDNFPDYALSYIVNGDASGIEDSDVTNCDDWLNHLESKLRRDYAGTNEISITVEFEDGEGNEFTPYPAFGLACGTVKCAVCVWVENEDSRPKIALPWEEEETEEEEEGEESIA